MSASYIARSYNILKSQLSTRLQEEKAQHYYHEQQHNDDDDDVEENDALQIVVLIPLQPRADCIALEADHRAHINKILFSLHVIRKCFGAIIDRDHRVLIQHQRICLLALQNLHLIMKLLGHSHHLVCFTACNCLCDIVKFLHHQHHHHTNKRKRTEDNDSEQEEAQHEETNANTPSSWIPSNIYDTFLAALLEECRCIFRGGAPPPTMMTATTISTESKTKKKRQQRDDSEADVVPSMMGSQAKMRRRRRDSRGDDDDDDNNNNNNADATNATSTTATTTTTTAPTAATTPMGSIQTQEEPAAAKTPTIAPNNNNNNNNNTNVTSELKEVYLLKLMTCWIKEATTATCALDEAPHAAEEGVGADSADDEDDNEVRSIQDGTRTLLEFLCSVGPRCSLARMFQVFQCKDSASISLYPFAVFVCNILKLLRALPSDTSTGSDPRVRDCRSRILDVVQSSLAGKFCEALVVASPWASEDMKVAPPASSYSFSFRKKLAKILLLLLEVAGGGGSGGASHDSAIESNTIRMCLDLFHNNNNNNTDAVFWMFKHSFDKYSAMDGETGGEGSGYILPNDAERSSSSSFISGDEGVIVGLLLDLFLKCIRRFYQQQQQQQQQQARAAASATTSADAASASLSHIWGSLLFSSIIQQLQDKFSKRMQGVPRVRAFFLVFGRQDTILMESLLNLLHIYCDANNSSSSIINNNNNDNNNNNNTNRLVSVLELFHPVEMFYGLLRYTSFDASLLLDFLISNETCFLEYFIL